jgi:hypothetical protein
MKTTPKRAVSVFLAMGLMIGLCPASGADAAAEPTSVTIATGRVGGLYHPVGGAICKLVDEGSAEHGISCTVKITSGSIDNIESLREGKVDLAMAQSDWQAAALTGTGPFEEAGPYADLRAVFAPYVEHFTIVARSDRDINSFEDLKGKRLFLGRTGGGRRQTMKVLMDAYGWTGDPFEDVSEIKASNAAEALCSNEFDAAVVTIGHPSPTVRDAMAMCGAVLVPVSGPVVDKLVEENAYFVTSAIPAGTYRTQPREIPTLAVVATLVTTAQTNPEAIYQITKSFFENYERLREASPLFASLDKHEMVTKGITAPFHDGALRYFAEAGLK